MHRGGRDEQRWMDNSFPMPHLSIQSINMLNFDVFYNLRLSLNFQALQVEDKVGEQHQEAIGDNDVPNDVTENRTVKVDDSAKLNLGSVTSNPRKVEENDDISSFRLTVLSDVVEETSLDEGWQEANSKGRSGNTSTSRKFGRRKPVLAKLNLQNEHSNSRYGRENNSPPKNMMPKSVPVELSPQKQSMVLAKPSVLKVSPSPTTHSAMASKSLSYKEVALAPPGTVLKPLLDRAEEIAPEKPETKTSHDTTETPKQEESKSNNVVETFTKSETVGTQVSETQVENTGQELEEEKSKEKNGSKLSAAAEPFSPITVAMPHPLNSVVATSVYDVIASQEMLTEPVVVPPPVVARVPCGPRSPLFYRTNYSFHMRHDFHKLPTQRIMNPNAPEFVPKRAWQTNPVIANAEVPAESAQLSSSDPNNPENEKQVDEEPKVSVSVPSKKSISESEKSELARQILLSFIVKSVQHNMDSSTGESKKPEHVTQKNQSDAIENDSAIIKIHYGNTESSSEAQKVVEVDDVNKNNGGDGEGFIVVTKRRKNRQQFTNGVTGLYSQQSICASVR